MVSIFYSKEKEPNKLMFKNHQFATAPLDFFINTI